MQSVGGVSAVEKCFRLPPFHHFRGGPKCILCAGAKILLNNAVLNLKRGKRYGLCGPNGCGKSTLMRSIANGQVKEFPPQDELKTVYVEHDIDAEETQQSVINYVASDSQLQSEPLRPPLICQQFYTKAACGAFAPREVDLQYHHHWQRVGVSCGFPPPPICCLKRACCIEAIS